MPRPARAPLSRVQRFDRPVAPERELTYHRRIVAVSASGIEQALAASIPALAGAPAAVPRARRGRAAAGVRARPVRRPSCARCTAGWCSAASSTSAASSCSARAASACGDRPRPGGGPGRAGAGHAAGRLDLSFVSRSDRPEHARSGPDGPVRVLPRAVLVRPIRPATGVFPIQIVIGDQSLHAVGAGMGFALQHQPHVAVAAVGDGATSQGDFLESLNFAARLQSPGRAVRAEQSMGDQRAARAPDARARRWLRRVWRRA